MEAETIPCRADDAPLPWPSEHGRPAATLLRGSIRSPAEPASLRDDALLLATAPTRRRYKFPNSRRRPSSVGRHRAGWAADVLDRRRRAKVVVVDVASVDPTGQVALHASHTPPPFPEPLSSASAVLPVIEDDPFIVKTPSDPTPPPDRTAQLPVTDDESFMVVFPVLPL